MDMHGCVHFLLHAKQYRALFEKDKLVFSFMLCGEIMKTAGLIDIVDWNYFLRGATGSLDKVVYFKKILYNSC